MEVKGQVHTPVDLSHLTYWTADFVGLTVGLTNYRYRYSRTALRQLRVKSKVHPTRGHEDPEGEQRYKSILSLAWALEGVGGQHHAPAALPSERDPVPISIYVCCFNFKNQLQRSISIILNNSS